MWSDLLLGLLVVACLPVFLFLLLFVSKLIGYGLEAGRHKFLNRRKNRGA